MGWRILMPLEIVPRVIHGFNLNFFRWFAKTNMKLPSTSSPETLALDVFGTLLFRRISDPEKRFASLAGEGEGAKDWVRRRVAAEGVLAREKGPDLYSLEDIYGILGPGGPTALKEKEMELAQSFVASEARRLLQAARERRKPVLFVSDMYLPGHLIQQLLARHGLWREGDRLFVSHEQGAAKHGGLFQKICRELSLAPGQLEHVGDHPRSDVLVPRRLGIRAVHFRVGEPSRYEARWAEKGGAKGAMVADAIRAARLQFPEALDEQQQIFWETAGAVAGPLFLAYVIWLERKARELELERLYFIARDGLILKKIYDRLFPAGGSSPSSHYLYGSRQAWGCVRAAFLLEQDIEALLEAAPSLSLRQFFARCGWSTPPLIPLRWSGPPPTGDDPLRPEQLDQLRAWMRQGELRTKIQERGQERLREARAFLEQEGLGAGRYGVVDLGWYGNLQSFLERILPENPPAAGFYLDLRKKPRTASGSLRKAFLPFGRFRGMRASVATTLLEILAAAPHGTVLGYEFSNQKWVPVVAKPTGPFGPEAHAMVQHEAILKTAEELRLQGMPEGTEACPDYARAMLENLEALMANPSRREAEVYGSIHFISRQEGGVETEFAPALGAREAWALAWKGLWSREALWPQACLRRNRGWAGFILRARFLLTVGKEKAGFLLARLRGEDVSREGPAA